MLNADVPVPNVVSCRDSTYGRIFHELLSAAATRIAPNTTVESTNYDVRQGEYPTALSEVDVLLITGSASSAYDDFEWIRRLDAYVYDIYTNHPQIKLFGSCFGHQLICQSLLREFGVVVEKDPNGWELGVKEIRLTQDFRTTLENASKSAACAPLKQLPNQLRLQMVHADHVQIPSLPHSWLEMGSTEHCRVQGVYQPGRVLTFQGHFEFDRFINSETLKVFAAGWDTKVLEEALYAVDADDDSIVAAEMVLRFMMESVEAKAMAHMP
jgi:GMP synthase-like glutamine amidotransferase